MKGFIACCLMGLAVSLSPFCHASHAREIVRLTNGEWLPFQSENALQHHGIISRIVTEAFAAQGIDVVYGFFPWKRSLHYARTGVWDGSLAWAKDRSDFKDDFYFSDPILTVPKSLFYLKTTPLRYEKIKDLSGLAIGVSAGFTYGEAFDRAKREGVFTAQEVFDEAQNINKLLQGRIDAFAMEIDVAYYLLHNRFEPGEINRITYHPKLLVTSEMCVIFPKRSKEAMPCSNV